VFERANQIISSRDAEKKAADFENIGSRNHESSHILRKIADKDDIINLECPSHCKICCTL